MNDIDLALSSLKYFDDGYPRPAVVDLLEQTENRDLLHYVHHDPFGAHVFPGDISNYPVKSFLHELDQELCQPNPIHLWAYIPTCRYRCHFCQFPVVLVNPAAENARKLFSEVIDLNIREAKLWLAAVPHLATVPVGEFNLFGGTPSLLPTEELARLVDFYRNHFNLSEASLRLEGEPGSLTTEFLTAAYNLGFSKISFGAQSFNDAVIRNAGRPHSAQECFDVFTNAKSVGIDWVSVDLIYGLGQQSLLSVKQDIAKVRELDIKHLVYTKLHLKDFLAARTGVSMQRPSVWQKKLAATADGERPMRLPSLGMQYQMRELIDHSLSGEYDEHPNMYYYRKGEPPEKWKGIITDQDKQFPEVAIGMGGSSKCRSAEAINHTEYAQYKASVSAGILPVGSVNGMSPGRQEVNSFKMALSTCQPVRDELHRNRFGGRSYLNNKLIADGLATLEKRKLIHVSSDNVYLSKSGRVLVEAIINTQFE